MMTLKEKERKEGGEVYSRGVTLERGGKKCITINGLLSNQMGHLWRNSADVK